MDVFDEMGIDQYGILLSEKDSITYTNALAPELRKLTDPNRIHRVPDYSGATKEERQERIRQIANIANSNGYNAIFAGYGFMSEDAEMGIDQYGILLSEKDSITYTNALAPELRKLTDPNRIHRVPDYSGATKEERQERIRQIANIANSNGYNAIFAGYGFMSEDAEMV